MKLYQVVCEDYKAHKFIPMGDYWQAKGAFRAKKKLESMDNGIAHKVYRVVIFKIGD